MGFRSMLLLYLFSIVFCSPHSQNFKNGFRERVEDGNFNARDSNHYQDGRHNDEFDHEAILGSRKAAAEFDNLPPEEAKKRLLQIAVKMDANKDDYVDKKEIVNWVLRSFKMLTEEDSLDEFEEEDANEDGKVTWEEHASETYGVFYDNKKEMKDTPDELQMYEWDMKLFKAADLNGDEALDKEEFPGFTHPEEFEHMQKLVYDEAMQKKDTDNDGFLSFDEFIVNGYESNPDPTTERFILEKDRFDDLDSDGDKKLKKEEIMNWLIPNNVEIAETEADHLIETSDTNRDGKLSLDEIIEHYDNFVHSEVTDFGEQLRTFHMYRDEL